MTAVYAVLVAVGLTGWGLLRLGRWLEELAARRRACSGCADIFAGVCPVCGLSTFVDEIRAAS